MTKMMEDMTPEEMHVFAEGVRTGGVLYLMALAGGTNIDYKGGKKYVIKEQYAFLADCVEIVAQLKKTQYDQ